MMLNGGATPTMFVPRRISLLRTVCLASRVDIQQLRTQLDQLHSEADNARAKVSKARLRLMRLSEAAENLQRQAAISVEKGKEDNARELLFQKKKAMQALEKSKSRIELLDELSTKLNEAIAVRETELVGAISLDLEADREDASTPVRIVYPQEENTEIWENNEHSDCDSLKFSENKELEVYVQDQADFPTNTDPNNLEGSLQDNAQGLPELQSDGEPSDLEGCLIGNDNDVPNSLIGISSYEDFLEHIDQRLNKIETELDTVVRLSTLILDSENPKNLKVQQTMEILEAVRRIRERIAVIMRTKLEIR